MRLKTKHFSISLLLSILFIALPLSAEPLETNFYRLDLPENWLVERNSAGLWMVGPSEDSLWKLTLSRLSASPDVYFQATARLWDKIGEVRLLEDLSDGPKGLIVFEVIPRNGTDTILKFCRWNSEFVWIASRQMPVEQREEALNMAQRFTGNIQFENPEFEPESLQAEIGRTLVEHEKLTSLALHDLNAVRTEMTSFRQDWEAFFPHSKPPLFEKFRKYLEARYDASFALNNAETLGMPEDLVDSRIDSVEKWKVELLLELDREFRWADEGL